VTVTLLSFIKNNRNVNPELNGIQVPLINQYLDDNISTKRPHQLDYLRGKSFEGVKIYGDGFIIDKKHREQLI